MNCLQTLRNNVARRLDEVQSGMPTTPKMELSIMLDLIDSIQRQESKPEISIFDKIEQHSNCTVQILSNSMTGEVSIGWWENE